MFCSNCGNKISDNKKFCSGCGTPVSAAPLSQSAPVAPSAESAAPIPQSGFTHPDHLTREVEHVSPGGGYSDGSIGKLLISGNGKGNSAIIFWSFYFIISAAASYLFICSFLPNAIRNSRRTGNMVVDSLIAGQMANRIDPADVMFVFGLVFAFSCIVFAVLSGICIAKTEIKICENGIEGKGLGKNFFWGDIRLFSFRLAYNQITSVDATNTSVVVHASNAQYKCYVENAGEIQNIIFNQRR